MEEDSIPQMIGTAQHVAQPDVEQWPVAVLWLPDPDTRRGWSMRQVFAKKDEPTRHAGFRR